MRRGFTLLEVLVSFALLSGLLSLLLQSQGEAVFFLERTSLLEAVQEEAQNRLMDVERKGQLPQPAQGTYPPDHRLAGGTWTLETGSQDFMGFELTRIKCTIQYPDRGGTSTYAAQIWGEL